MAQAHSRVQIVAPDGSIAQSSVQIVDENGDFVALGGGSAITAKDEGSTLTAALTSLDFVGAGVTATNTGGAVTVTIDGVATNEFVDNVFRIKDDGDNSKKVAFQCSGISASTTRTITVPDADLTLVGTGTSQTLTSKTFDNTNTVTLKDTLFTLQDNGDTTKQAQFELSSIGTGTTRTLTVQNVSGTVYVTGGTDVAVTDGGTGSSTATGGFDALSPMTTLGDTLYGGASGTRTRLGGNTTTTRKFLRQVGDGANSAAPAWDTFTVADIPTNVKTREIAIVIDGGGSAITATTSIEQYGYYRVQHDCTIRGVSLLADASGSIVVDIWKDTYANYPPTVADTITASAKPTLSSAQKSEDTTLTGWTTSLTAGDVLFFNIDSASTVKKVVLTLKVEDA